VPSCVRAGGTALWDVACNIAGERALNALARVSEASYLNPGAYPGSKDYPIAVGCRAPARCGWQCWPPRLRQGPV
jgi:hypothetical protein